MFIDEVMTKVWEPSYQEYLRCYEEASKMSAEDLFERVKNTPILVIEDNMMVTCALKTSGCTHHIRKDRMTGCSFCDLHTDHQEIEAYLKALQDKDVTLYAKAIRHNILNTRGEVKQRYVKEYMLCHNFLDQNEVPDEVLNELFGPDGIYKKKAMYYELETNVKSLTLENLTNIERYFGKGKAWLRVGIECKDDWLRNHWLNKNLTNKEIEDAVKLCHERGHKIIGNVMFGLPGLTEEQSLEEFKNTILWMTELEIDMYSVSVMNRKEKTLQGLIYRTLEDSEPLMEMGLVQKEHTGLPWLFTILKGIDWGLRTIPNFQEKMAFGQLIQSYIPGKTYDLAYNESAECSCFSKTYEVFKKLIFQHDWNRLEQLIKEMKEDNCYKAYHELIEKQRKASSVRDTVFYIGKELAKALWPEDGQAQIEKFKAELQEK